jgi:hypothetical protein
MDIYFTFQTLYNVIHQLVYVVDIKHGLHYNVSVITVGILQR